MDHIVMARIKKIPRCLTNKSPKRKPFGSVSGSFQYPYTVREGRKQKKSLQGKYKEQQKIAADGSRHTVRTTDNKNLHRKLLSTPLRFQRSTRNVFSPKNINREDPAEKT